MSVTNVRKRSRDPSESYCTFDSPTLSSAAKRYRTSETDSSHYGVLKTIKSTLKKFYDSYIKPSRNWNTSTMISPEEEEDEVVITEIVRKNEESRSNSVVLPTFGGIGIAGRQFKKSAVPCTFTSPTPAFRVSTEQKKKKERCSGKPHNILKRYQGMQNTYDKMYKPDFLTSRRKVIRAKTTLGHNSSLLNCRNNAFAESIRLEEKAKYKDLLSACHFPSAFNPAAQKSPSYYSLSAATFNNFKSPNSTIVKRPTEVIDLGGDDDEPVAESTPIVQSSSKIPTRPTKINDSSSTPVIAAKRSDDDIVEILNQFTKPKNKKSNFSTLSKSPPGLNSLEAELSVNKVYQDDFLDSIKEKYAFLDSEHRRKIEQAKVCKEYAKEKNEKNMEAVEKRIRQHLAITDVDIEVEEDEEELPEITPEMDKVIERSLRTPGTLIDEYKIPISAKDLATLRGLNWLNDEVINFYLQMIVARSAKDSNMPKVYATNTFFYPKLMQSGHSALKRWTRKVDIFSYDIILIPVHLGMHWCLATVDFRTPGVYYYDSMSGDNPRCLTALKKYLEDEHKDKKKEPYDASHFREFMIKDSPQQMNGSDCGMFTCKTAEYLSRDADLTFSQENMPYFRRRMIFEIVQNNLLHP